MNHNIIITESSSELKSMARTILKNNWKSVSIAILIYMCLSSFIPTILESIPILSYNYSYEQYGFTQSFRISGIAGIYQFILEGVLQFGLMTFLLNTMRTRKVENGLLFAGFGVFLKAFLAGLLVDIFTGLWMLLFVIPGIIAIYRYFATFYIMVDNPQLGSFDCITASKNMMKGNKAKVFLTHLSFIGWIIVAMIPQFIVTGAMGLKTPAFVFAVVSCVAMIPQAVLYAYFYMTNTVMYEIMAGHLYRQQQSPYGSNRYNGGYDQPGSGYGQPGSGYGQPGGDQYRGYSQNGQGGYGQQSYNGYNDAGQSAPRAGYGYNQPNNPPYGQQTGTPYGQPSGNPYSQPVNPSYGQPAYGQPVGNPYEQPAATEPAPAEPAAVEPAPPTATSSDTAPDDGPKFEV